MPGFGDAFRELFGEFVHSAHAMPNPAGKPAALSFGQAVRNVGGDSERFHAVHGQAVFALEGAHRIGGGSAICAVHLYGRDGAFVLRQRVQPKLQLLHGAAGGAGAQDRAAPGAVREGAAGSLALAGKLGRSLTDT